MNSQIDIARYVKAPVGFKLRELDATGFPIVLWKDGVHEASHYYLFELAYELKYAVGTCIDYAGILCGWFNLLFDAGQKWDQPEPSTFRRWAHDGDGRSEAEATRRRHRAHVVFNFYEYLARKELSTLAILKFVDELSAPVPVDVAIETGKVARRLQLRFGSKADQRFMRPTPSDRQAELVAHALLRDGESYKEVRDWLLATSAVGTGMRTQGLQQLTIERLDQILRADGIISRGGTLLDGVNSTPARSSIRIHMDQLEAAGRRYLELKMVHEKGKVRTVAVPLTIMRKWAEYVWGERADFIARKPHIIGKNLSPLWISTKTGKELTTKSIGDILAKGFRDAKVDGSGHRLRATFAIRLLRELIADDSIANWNNLYADAILDRLAQRLGHNNPATLRPYLHAVVMEQFEVDISERGLVTR